MNDTHRIQGEWSLIAGERHGEMFSAEAINNVTLTFSGNVLRTSKPDGETEATFVLHPETDPKGIDLDMEGNVGLGIYKLDGDSLSILHGEIEQPRPKDFSAITDGTLTLLELRKSRE
jgi:uncharacterized protein (TIGR03067 family)